MSKYHPIDVRHPANRQYRNRNYLLDPPAPDAGSPSPAPASRSAATFARRPAQPARPSAPPSAAAPAAPWGRGTAASSTDTFAPAKSLRFWRLLRVLLVLGVIGWVLSRETGLLDQMVFRLRIWAHELGLPLPF